VNKRDVLLQRIKYLRGLQAGRYSLDHVGTAELPPREESACRELDAITRDLYSAMDAVLEEAGLVTKSNPRKDMLRRKKVIRAGTRILKQKAGCHTLPLRLRLACIVLAKTRSALQEQMWVENDEAGEVLLVGLNADVQITIDQACEAFGDMATRLCRERAIEKHRVLDRYACKDARQKRFDSLTGDDIQVIRCLCDSMKPRANCTEVAVAIRQGAKCNLSDDDNLSPEEVSDDDDMNHAPTRREYEEKAALLKARYDPIKWNFNKGPTSEGGALTLEQRAKNATALIVSLRRTIQTMSMTDRLGKCLHYIRTNNTGDLTRMLRGSSYLRPEGHPFVFDETTKQWRWAQSAEDQNEGTAQVHTKWCGESEATTMFHFGELTRDEVGVNGFRVRNLSDRKYGRCREPGPRSRQVHSKRTWEGYESTQWEAERGFSTEKPPER
jgi:hypothetical protein